MSSLFRKKKVILPAALAAIIFLVTFVPFILSSSFVLEFFLSSVNRRVPGNLTVDSWLVGWRQGILCQKVVYRDPERGIRITVPRVTSTRGFLELALAPANLGRLIIDSPLIELTGTKQPPSEVSAQRPTAPGSAGASNRAPWWEKMSVDLVLRDGHVNMKPDGTNVVAGLGNCSIDATLDRGVVTFDLNLPTLHNQGVIKAGGSLNLPARKHGWVDTMIAEADLSIIGLQVRDLLMLTGGRWSLPTGEGILNADFSLKAVGLEGVQVSGDADFTDLKLNGGFLVEDTPSFQKINLKVDGGHWAKKSWSVKQFDLVSDMVEVHGSGQYDTEHINLEGRGSIILPVMFDQFSHRLKLQEAAFIEKGSLDFDLDLLRSRQQASIELRVTAADLGGLYEGRPFSWSTPVALRLNGEIIDRDARVNILRLDAPFLHAEGRGDLNNFLLEAKADLDQAFVEVGRLFQLEWGGSGKAEMTMKGSLFSMEDDLARIETDMHIDDFALSRSGDAVVPAHDLTLVGGVQAPRSWVWERRGTLDLQMALTTWFGELFLACNGEKTIAEPFRAYYSTDASLDLESVSRLLQRAAVMPGDGAAAGDLQVQAAGYLDGRSVEIRELQGEVDGFVLRRQGSVFEDDRIRLEIRQEVNEDMPLFAIRELAVADSKEEFLRTGAGFNLVSFADHDLFLRNLSLTSATGTITVKELLVDDWRNPLDKLSVNLDGGLDLTRLSRLLQAAGLLSAKTEMAGSGTVALHSGDTAGDGKEMRADLLLTDFSLTRHSRELFSREEMSMKAVLHGLADGKAAIRMLRFRSRPLDLTATGLLMREEERQEVELKGEMTPDLERFAAILRAAFDIELTMTGSRREPFQLRFPLTGVAEDKAAVTFTAAIRADELRYRGLEVREMAMPVSYGENRLRLEANGGLNEGRLEVVADGDFTAEPAVLRIPENSRIMTGVELRQPLVDGLLSGIHPLFGVLAKPAGRLDVRLDSFTWPLRTDGGKDAAFIAVFDVSNIDLDSGAVLKEILAWFNLDKERLSLKDREIYCAGQAGRIVCSPVRLRIADAEMVLRGSVGMDQTLDYLLEVPVTGKLVSEGVYQSLGETTIGVPIRGTIDKPVFDGKMITGAIRDLAKKAAAGVRQRQSGRVLSGQTGDIPLSQKKK